MLATLTYLYLSTLSRPLVPALSSIAGIPALVPFFHARLTFFVSLFLFRLPLLRLLVEPSLVQLLTSQPASAGFLELLFRVGQGFEVSLLSVELDPPKLVLFQLLLRYTSQTKIPEKAGIYCYSVSFPYVFPPGSEICLFLT